MTFPLTLEKFARRCEYLGLSVTLSRVGAKFLKESTEKSSKNKACLKEHKNVGGIEQYKKQHVGKFGVWLPAKHTCQICNKSLKHSYASISQHLKKCHRVSVETYYNKHIVSQAAVEEGKAEEQEDQEDQSETKSDEKEQSDETLSV